MSFNHPADTYSMCLETVSVHVCVCANNEIEPNNNETTTIDCALPPQVRSYLSGHINSYSDSYRALCRRPLPKRHNNRLERRMSSRMSQAFFPLPPFLIQGLGTFTCCYNVDQKSMEFLLSFLIGKLLCALQRL